MSISRADFRHAALFGLGVLLAGCALWFVACDSDDDESEDEADDDDNSPDDDDDDDDRQPWREIDQAALEDKISGSWVGQMAGVTWGASTEFRYNGRTIPEDEVPQWQPALINSGFLQDDLYVEIPFIDALSAHGVNASWVLLGEAFRDTTFPLWHANLAARRNLRNGLAAPGSGHYLNNQHCDDIDWQIEADFVGASCPGLVNQAIEMAWRTGHVMNYGDGVLGGVFISSMHSQAFFAQDLSEIIEAGRLSLPLGSEFRQVVEDVLAWHDQGLPWETVWMLLQDKWGTDDRCPDFCATGATPLKNIDAKLNGAYVLIGLLYGEGDIEASMRIAMRCGQDSDCNPSSVGGILGNWVGLSGIPDKFKSALNSGNRFLFTEYTFGQSVALNLELARRVLLLSGAIEGSDQTWSVPPAEPIQPPLLEQWPIQPSSPPALSIAVVSQQGLSVELAAQASDTDGVLDYEWYFGDLTRTRGPSVSHTYAVAGTYQVIAWVADNLGDTSWQELWLSVP